MSRRATTIMGLALVASGVPALGVEGRIPIFAQTTITESGSYIVTQDFSVAAGNGITISASPVTLDLNGHTITMPPVGYGIVLNATALIVRIRDGRILGGSRGISGSGDATVTVEGLEIDGSDYGIRLAARTATVTTSTLRNIRFTAIYVDGTVLGAPVTARLMDNVITDTGIGLSLNGCVNSEVGGNVITSGAGMDLGECTATRIHDNSLSQPPGDLGLTLGIYLPVGAGNNVIRDNAVRGYAQGIAIESYGNLVIQNHVAAGGTGIIVWGNRNLFEGNQPVGNTGCGLEFRPLGGAFNAYRNNMLRSNSGGGVCDLVGNNTNAGGNIL